MSLQDASTAREDYDRAMKGHVASVLPLHPTVREPKNVSLNLCHVLFERQLRVDVCGL